MYGIVYRITNTINGKKYIGKTTSLKNRWKQHTKDARKKDPKYPIHRAINAYGENKFTIEQIAKANSFEELNDLEKLNIIKEETLAPNGYNLTLGGEGVLGYKHSEETLRKMSQSALFRAPVTKETRERMSYSANGKSPVSAQTRKKISASNTPTHCKRGHLLDEVNAYIKPYNGTRNCKTCAYLREGGNVPVSPRKYVLGTEVFLKSGPPK